MERFKIGKKYRNVFGDSVLIVKRTEKTIVHQGFNKDGSERYRPTRSKLEHINNTEAINVNSIAILRADIKA